jgi:hypothetical protein
MLLTVALPLSPAGSQAEESGAWVPTRVQIKSADTVAQSWERQLREIEALVKAVSVFREIRGYFPLLVLKAEPLTGSRGSWVGYVLFEAWWPHAITRAADGTPAVKPSFEFNRPEGLWIGINTMRDLSHWNWWEDAAGRFYLLPETRREIAGFPVVGDRMFITRPGKAPLFDPLPLERALRWTISSLKRQAKADDDGFASARRHYEQFISPAGQEKRQREIEAAAASQRKPENQAQARRQAEAIDRRREQDLREAVTQKPGSPQGQTAALLASLERRLEGLSATERTQPAWLKTEPKVRGAAGDIVPPNTTGARPLVTIAAFIDPALPLDAMQLVTVPVQPFEDHVRKGDRKPQAVASLAVIEQTDWRAVRKLLR